MELFRLGFLPVRFIDLVDVFAVTVVFYQVYRIIKGTRATQMFAGLLFILAAGSIVGLLGMSGMTWLIQSIGAVWVIAFVILFQPELRRLLVRIGQMGVLRSILNVESEKVIAQIASASVELSRKRFGGLIVMQRTTGLRGVIETGIELQAEVSSELLVSIFFPRSPLHDGAVIISGEAILAAKCILPLTPTPPEASLGTRHQAAIGITEEVDAIAIVVSEETGTISVVCDGRFVERNLDESALRNRLNQLMYSKSKFSLYTKERNPLQKGATPNQLKSQSRL